MSTVQKPGRAEFFRWRRLRENLHLFVLYMYTRDHVYLMHVCVGGPENHPSGAMKLDF